MRPMVLLLFTCLLVGQSQGANILGEILPPSDLQPDYLTCSSSPALGWDAVPSPLEAFRVYELDRVCLVRLGRGLNYLFENAAGDGLIYSINDKSEAFFLGERRHGRIRWSPRQFLFSPVGKIVPTYRPIRASTPERLLGIAVDIPGLRTYIDGFSALEDRLRLRPRR